MATLKVLVSFNSVDGTYPHGSLITDAAGDLFGTTSSDGSGNAGTVFEIAKTANGYNAPQVLVSFNGTNGNVASASLIMDTAGDLFGTTEQGGVDGTVFEITKNANGYNSTPSVLGTFTGANGEDPYGSLIMDAAGDLFGQPLQEAQAAQARSSRSPKPPMAIVPRKGWLRSTALMAVSPLAA